MQQRLLRKIVDYQLLYSPYMHDIGLFHGKMGVVVALKIRGSVLLIVLGGGVFTYDGECALRPYEGYFVCACVTSAGDFYADGECD